MNLSPASTRLVEIDHWLDRWVASLSPIARMLVEGAILTACAALVIVTAVLFATANPGG